MALDTVSIGQAAKDLGVPISTLHAWVAQSSISPNEHKENGATNEQKINVKILLDKNRELQKRIRSPRTGEINPKKGRDVPREIA